jgi:hypothetical protein
VHDFEHAIVQPYGQLAGQHTAYAFRPEVPNSLGLSFGAQEHSPDFGHVQLALAGALSDEKVLIALDPVRSGPTLRHTNDQDETTVYWHSSHLDTGCARFYAIEDAVLNAPRFVVWITSYRVDGRRPSLAILVDTINQVTAGTVRKGSDVGKQLMAPCSVQARHVSLKVQVRAFCRRFSYERPDVSLSGVIVVGL